MSYLTEITGRKTSQEGLASAVDESNAARGAVRRLMRLRRGKNPRLNGGEAVRTIGAWYFMDRKDYPSAAQDLVSELLFRPPFQGPRIMIKGVSLDHPALHDAIEAEGAVVTAEDDWRASRAAGTDIRTAGDPVRTIFEKYFVDAPSPRTFPPDAADRWFQAAVLRDIDGVVFYLPPEDDVSGWEYPRQRRWLEQRGIPNLMIRDDARSLSDEARTCITDFVAGLRVRGSR